MQPAETHPVELVAVAGARPNFMKIAPLLRELRTHGGFRTRLVHTGQHYDDMMSGAFVRDLALPTPDYDLGVGSASHAVQTARVMIEFEQVCLSERPHLVVVVGDVNSTLAASLVAAKLLIPVAHVEAGLRSNDRTMPEEINRIVTDRLSDVLLTPSPDADANLIAAVGTPVLDGLGPVGGDDHSPDEWVDLASLPQRVALLAGLIAEPGLAVS